MSTGGLMSTAGLVSGFLGSAPTSSHVHGLIGPYNLIGLNVLTDSMDPICSSDQIQQAEGTQRA